MPEPETARPTVPVPAFVLLTIMPLYVVVLVEPLSTVKIELVAAVLLAMMPPLPENVPVVGEVPPRLSVPLLIVSAPLGAPRVPAPLSCNRPAVRCVPPL